ncbi:helix-turn-helix domain-containing protein [Pseudomonas sp. NMI542_15]|uniref:helix-turn-helix domain-containing protein n=1 Tax=Pseudomonas sp. NMI542_15 TaxID=2903148 RepID=UPI001E5DA0CF|nr:helix-turn-helix domain-containing protein [Pseudomonas sp. NMI542_15]MCE0777562.1 hypothetical protein [Pseudomonas sp. NMI542_15]
MGSKKCQQQLSPEPLVHFFDDYVDMFCCSAPIWGAWGKMVGVLNISGHEAFKSKIVESKIYSAAMKIENRIFIDSHKNNPIYQIHYDPDFISTHLSGLIATNKISDILSATQNAIGMLDDINPLRKRYSLKDIFTNDFIAASGYCLKTQMRSGVVLYVRSLDDDNSGALCNKAAIRSNGSVRDLSELHILETIKKCGGNISKSAKSLGVSRTTLYRVLSKKR